VGVKHRLAYETPTLTLPLSTRGGEEEGLQNASRTLAPPPIAYVRRGGDWDRIYAICFNLWARLAR
jgi:hypothetical protein